MLPLALGIPALAVSALIGWVAWRDLFRESHQRIPSEWRWKLARPVLIGALSILPFVQLEASSSWRFIDVAVISYCITFVIIFHLACPETAFFKMTRRVRVLRSPPLKLRAFHVLFFFYLLGFLLPAAILIGSRARA